MRRAARRSAPAFVLVAPAVCAAALTAAEPPPVRPADPSVLERFLAADGRAPEQYRALRRMDAHNGKFKARAWMDVWTEADRDGFRYEIAARGGSNYIHTRVFIPSLETERKMWAHDGSERGAISPANYVFEDRGTEPDGLAQVDVRAKRKDVLLVNGSIFLRPDDGDLVRMVGALSKTPSFWARRIEITREYARVGGVRLPVAMQTTATVLIAGKSSFSTVFEYASVNGEPVGDPVPRAE